MFQSGGNPPLLGEPPIIEFVNTIYAAGSERRDGLSSRSELRHWLSHQAPRLGLSPGGVERAPLQRMRDLRDAVRECCTASVAGRRLPEAAVRRINDASRAGPLALSLVQGPGGLVASARVAGPASTEATALLARAAVELLGGPGRERLRACGAPGCVLFFLKDHPRRAWCSAPCGNRARVSRHYHRHQTTRV